MRNKFELRTVRAQQAVRDLLDGSNPVAAQSNLRDFGVRAAIRAQELADAGWVPIHSDILEARELLAKLMPLHETDILTGKMDEDFRMTVLCAGVSLGRGLEGGGQ